MPRDAYSSPLRAENANRTRERIRAAARELFGGHGFEATTVNQIAARAGVSPATVYATFQSKAGIVSSLLEHLEAGIDMGSRVGQMRSEADPHRQLRLFVATNRLMFERSADVLRAARDAMSFEDVATLKRAGDRNRRGGCELVASTIGGAGALRPGLSVEQAVDRLWLLSSVELYLLCVDDLGWTPDAYESWLIDAAERELITTSDGRAAR